MNLDKVKGHCCFLSKTLEVRVQFSPGRNNYVRSQETQNVGYVDNKIALPYIYKGQCSLS